MTRRLRRLPAARLRIGSPLGTVTALAATLAGGALMAGHPAYATPTPGTPSATTPAVPAPPTASTPVEETEETEEPELTVPVDPLQVSIDRITPGVVPERGPVRVQGRITNVSEEEWSDLAVYLVTSAEPITTRAELADAVASEPLSECPQSCSRIVEEGLFVDAPDLAPGETARFRLSVPRGRLGLSGEPGVYWLGVQVLGSNAEGRVDGADGRARTFLPLVPRRTPSTQLAIALQVRNHTVRAADGRLEFLPGWQKTLAPQGRLGRLIALAGSSDAFPVDLIVDPAVLDAATSVAQGNPALTLGTETVEPVGSPEATEPTPSSSPSDDPAQGDPAQGDPAQGDPAQGDPAQPGDGDNTEGAAPEAVAEELTAAGWLQDVTDLAQDLPVHRLPYGDLDLAAAHDDAPNLLTAALERSDRALLDREIASSPLVAPLVGTLPPEALAGIDRDVPVVLDADFVAADGGPVHRRSDAGTLVAADSALVDGGPGPGATRSALALRQRILAETALHALSDDRRRPLFALLPATWDPGPRWSRADFLDGLDVAWLRPANLADVLDQSDADLLAPDAFGYPEAQAQAELPAYAVLATEQLRELGAVMGDLLADEDGFTDRVDALAMLTSSTFARVRPGLAVQRNRGTQERVRTWMEGVVVRGPSFVTMSSETGLFQVTVINQLDRPVTVGLRARVSGDALRLQSPETVTLNPKGRTAMRIDVTATDIGVHQVDLQPVTAAGEPVGEPLELSIRTSNVGFVVWVLMIAGGVVLVAAIGLRITRRVMSRRRTRAQSTAPGEVS